MVCKIIFCSEFPHISDKAGRNIGSRRRAQAIALRCGSINKFALEAKKFPQRLTREGLSDKPITNMAMNTAEMKKEATKHYSWGLCKSDSRYPESMTVGIHFTRFAKVGKSNDGMTEWEKNKQNEFTEKAKKWVHAYGRRGFTIDKITKDIYICSLHFVGENGPSEEDPDPISASLLECESVRKKCKKKRKRPLERDPLLAKKKKVRAKRTKKHSESEISPLNSTVQNDKTDFDEQPLVGEMSTLSTIPPYNEQESISFNISYGNVPLQSNEPEENEENETSKQPSVPTSPVKTDKSTQTKYNKYALCAKIENIVLKNDRNFKIITKQRH